MDNQNHHTEKSPFMMGGVRTKQQAPLWDYFENTPVEKLTGSMKESKYINNSTIILKILSYLVTFLVVLGGAVISKGTLLFMTSQIQPNLTKPFCKQFIDRNKEYTVQLPRLERTAWIWILIFTYFVPEILTFLRSLRICLYKSWKVPSLSEIGATVLTESLPAIGYSLLVFSILPELDVVKGVMLTNAVCFVPAVVGFLSRSPGENDNTIKFTLDILSMLAQATAFIVWPMIENKPAMWLIPVSVLFISCGWWENYVSEDSPIEFIKVLGNSKKNFKNNRYFIYLLISLWKCLVFFITTLIIIYVKEQAVSFLFTDFSQAFQRHTINITEIQPVIGDQIDFGDTLEQVGEKPIPAVHLTPVWVFLINISCTYLCYIFGKFSCKVSIQGFSYAFPINLSVPTTISLLIVICGIHSSDPCAFYPPIPHYLFFNSPPIYFLTEFITSQHVWIWMLWLLSQTWITIHLWYPRCDKLSKTEKLYVKPMYDAFLIDQSIALNRRRDDVPEKPYGSEDDDDDKTTNKECTTTKIYACACMWHENKDEMITFLKSIFRLDEDRCARHIVNTDLEGGIMYYDLETHIFFDDAFIRKNEKDQNPKINKFVKDFLEHVDVAAYEALKVPVRIKPPKKYVTPYGGRLEWTLPGNTLMIVHLKDIAKIRTKKRWSQVMYMYYLFGLRIMSRNDLSAYEKDLMANNTYLLALDGDIDFQPEGLHLLIELMKKNDSVGAACGRIHPLGSGPMVWYQMFEYAIGHWLQKATEHVIGCVLCSPGCFSLFRAKALMSDRIMRKYATQSKEARDFVQFDQGEDRWLCTLLLQKGFRVEYSAASDAYTHCPEGFNEFYNQRRRWMSSTTANILDLLMNYKHTVKDNDNISFLYIVYQIILMVGSVLGPGTIFLMLVGAFVAAFQLDQWSSFLWNIVPILFYMFICILFKSDVQLLVAGALSALYGLVMMAVLVGVMLQITQDGVLAPSSLFFFCIAGEFVITALMHPKEISCLLYGLVYYVTVPSMYMLLVIYAVFNLNNISWGTRDVTIEPEVDTAEDKNKEKEKEKDKDEIKKKSKHTVFSLFGGDNNENSGTFEFSIAGLIRCFVCTHKTEEPENKQLSDIMINLKQLTDKVQSLEKSLIRGSTDVVERRKTILQGIRGNNVGFEDIDNDSESDRKSLASNIYVEDDLPHWTEDKTLGKGSICSLESKEKSFWEDIIERYLFTYEDNEKEVAQKLKDLRDKSVMSFFMINAIFVLVVFLLTLKKDLIHADWPLDIKYNFTYYHEIREVKLSEKPLELEPIGFVFLIFFFSLLVVQFIAMLFHRFSTFSQILANTYINWNFFSKLKKENLTDEEILARNPVKVVKQLFKVEDKDEDKNNVVAIGRRKTIKQLIESVPKQVSISDFREAYEKNTEGGGPSKKSMVAAVQRRRTTVKYRKSVQFADNAYENAGYSHD